jgi:hypothetical protein
MLKQMPSGRLAGWMFTRDIDATRKWSSEGFSCPWPDEIVMDAKAKESGIE